MGTFLFLPTTSPFFPLFIVLLPFPLYAQLFLAIFPVSHAPLPPGTVSSLCTFPLVAKRILVSAMYLCKPQGRANEETVEMIPIPRYPLSGEKLCFIQSLLRNFDTTDL